jgi:hypothetical protein
MKKSTFWGLVAAVSLALCVSEGLRWYSQPVDAQFGPTSPSGGWVKITGAGIQIGQNSTDGIGFWGATPTKRLTLTVLTNTTANLAVTISNLNYIAIQTGLWNTN